MASQGDRGGSVWPGIGKRILIVCVVLVVATSMALGQTGGQDRSVTIRQGDQCSSVTPLAGSESVKAFYDYRTQSADNPYTNAVGSSYSSHGTVHLQKLETSVLFLYEDRNGTMSLVFVHGTFNGTDGVEGGDDGGSASFNITGLPAAGSWAVKDDEYESEENFDRWRHGPTSAEIDWTWGESATDGGAYAGLGETFEITIDPAFNETAALYGQHYEGTVRQWEVLSDTAGDPDRISLDLDDPVVISTDPCEDTAGQSADNDTDEGDESNENDEGSDAGDSEDDEAGGAVDDDETDEDDDFEGIEDGDDSDDQDQAEGEDEGGDDDEDESEGDDGSADEDNGDADEEDEEDVEDEEDEENGEDDDEDSERVVLCHTTNSEPNPDVTLSVSKHAVSAHLDHGDTLGSCD